MLRPRPPLAGADMLPLLLYEMHRAAARPIPLPSSVGIAELANGVETDRDYDIGMRNIESQKAHDVHATSSLRFEEDVWDCSTSDGYMCHCKRQAAAGGLADGGQLQLASGTAGTGQGARGRGCTQFEEFVRTQLVLISTGQINTTTTGLLIGPCPA